jgi:hypothetical protein
VNGPQHYEEAETALAQAEYIVQGAGEEGLTEEEMDAVEYQLALAGRHAQLAQVAATIDVAQGLPSQWARALTPDPVSTTG